MFRPLALAVAAALLTAAPAPAGMITNGSFESGTFVDNGASAMSLNTGATNMTGWTTTSAELAWLKNGNPYNVGTPYGSYFLDLTGYHDTAPYGGVYQDITTVAGQQYVLSFAVGYNPSNGDSHGPVGVTASAAGSSQTFTTASTGTGNQWETFSLAFTATSATTRVQLVGASTAGNYIGLDNVSVNPSAAAVPEPASVALLAVGGMGAFARRRLRRA